MNRRFHPRRPPFLDHDRPGFPHGHGPFRGERPPFRDGPFRDGPFRDGPFSGRPDAHFAPHDPGDRPGRGYGGPRRGRPSRDARGVILALLAEGPRNGYQIIQAIEERTHGAWRPSSGSVYPALQQLEDEGLVAPVEHEGRRAFALTEAGAAQVRERPAAPDLGDLGGDAGPRGELRRALRDLMEAARQVARTGTAAQVAEAASTLDGARRALYRLLAEDPA